MESVQTVNFHVGNLSILPFDIEDEYQEYTEKENIHSMLFYDILKGSVDDETIVLDTRVELYDTDRIFINNFTSTCCGGADQNPATPILYVPDVLYIIYSVYISLIFVLGLSQNSLTLYVFVKERCLRRSHNIFIIGLALSDVCMCVFSTWMVILSSAYHRWIFGYPGK